MPKHKRHETDEKSKKPLTWISGGQTGADQAGLAVARKFGLKTGGFMPKGWKTLEGSRPDIAELYGMTEHSSPDYRERTWANVELADATIIVVQKQSSPGEICTARAVRHYNKPCYVIVLDQFLTPGHYADHTGLKICLRGSMEECAVVLGGVILEHDEWTYNIAGNSESTVRGMYDFTYAILHKVLSYYFDYC
jgi:hypothetical protein